MRKISTKFALASLGLSLILTIILTGISAFQGNHFLSHEATEKLTYMSKGYSKDFESQLGKVESTVDVLYNTAYILFDSKAYVSDPENYGQVYSDLMENVIKENASNIEGIQGIYLTMHPDLLGHWNDLWYADVSGDGHYTRVDSTLDDPTVFTSDNEDYSYFFDPIDKNGPV